MKKEPEKIRVRVSLEMDLEINAQHQGKELERLIFRASGKFFPNNRGTCNSLKYSILENGEAKEIKILVSPENPIYKGLL